MSVLFIADRFNSNSNNINLPALQRCSLCGRPICGESIHFHRRHGDICGNCFTTTRRAEETPLVLNGKEAA